MESAISNVYIAESVGFACISEPATRDIPHAQLVLASECR